VYFDTLGRNVDNSFVILFKRTDGFGIRLGDMGPFFLDVALGVLDECRKVDGLTLKFKI
jgi:hypothetical protein